MPEQTYQGGCHCRALSYEVEIDLERGTMRCNCSLCSKVRAWFAFTPFEKFRMTEGSEEHEIRYRWTPPGKPRPNLTYHHCSNCGVRTHADGRDPKGNHIAAISVASLEGADPDVLEKSIHYVDGRHDQFRHEPDHTGAL